MLNAYTTLTSMPAFLSLVFMPVGMHWSVTWLILQATDGNNIDAILSAVGILANSSHNHFE